MGAEQMEPDGDGGLQGVSASIGASLVERNPNELDEYNHLFLFFRINE